MNSWTTHRDKILKEPIPASIYFQSVQDFAQVWLSGQDRFIITTSGSTGAPKEIALSRNQMVESARITGQVLELPLGTRALVCLNVAYIAGMMMIIRGLELGWQLTIVEPSSNPLLDLEGDLDFAAMVPMQLSSILNEKQTRERVEQLGKILLGGGTVSEGLLQAIRQLKVPVYQSYGMTETVSHVALRRLNGDNPQDSYHVMPGIEFGTDGRGCLHVRGAVTAHKLIQTNDLIEISSPTTFDWLGRVDSVINSGGVKISLDKLDRVTGEVLQQLNVSIEYFNWYEHDEILGQKLVLFLEGQPQNFDGKMLLEKISFRVNPYQTPKAAYFVPNFERTPTAKIDKIATARKYLNHTHE